LILPDDNRYEYEMSKMAPKPVSTPLPTPSERPEASIVVYDGQCRICTAQINKLPWWDCQQRLAYLSLHDSEVSERWPDLSHDRLMLEMIVLDPQGQRFWGPDSIRYLTRRLRRLWWLAPLLHIPGSMLLWRPLYRWIARNRYRLSGGEVCEEDACSLHQ